MIAIMTLLILLNLALISHELGHFFVAKSFGAKILSFTIGAGGTVASGNIRGIDCAIGVLPVAGAVQYSQEITSVNGITRPLGRVANILILLAGPAVNTALAVVLYSLVLGFIGEQHELPGPTVVAHINMDASIKTGLQRGDRILEVNGLPVLEISQVQFDFLLDGEHKFRIKRANKILNLDFKWSPTPLFNSRRPLLGVLVAPERVETTKYGFFSALGLATSRLSTSATREILSFFNDDPGWLDLVRPNLNVPRERPGANAIQVLLEMTHRFDWNALFVLAAILQGMIALMNLLPIPGLDGGNILMNCVGAMRGKPVETATEQQLARIGLGMIGIVSVVLVMINLMRGG